MKKLTLLLALVAFFAVGCAEEVETPPEDDIEAQMDEAMEDVDDAVDNMEAEMDSLGDTVEEGMEQAGEAMDRAEDTVDSTMAGDADGDGR